ncbi:MAG: undecaprenyl/decaprenyl-phosphate alpha-N-acetylglucosaminyl 1-phosphate transferase [Bacteroidia bacterium]|nr:undecaprenyl/decaprenyl-phosphate alpha-N-acetylglucosaminyl 1-phosphate transferase [Bacteroidia bacterium]
MENTRLLSYILFFVLITVFSVLLNGLLLKFSKTLGIRNEKDTIVRWNTQAKPSVGGISFYVAFLLSISGFSFFYGNVSIIGNQQFLGMLASCTVAFLMGLADDAYNTKPLLKFLAQVLCAVILILAGIVIHIFPYNWANYLFTIFWVVGMMNSINMLDNMDAITATVSVTIIIAALLIIAMNHNFSTNIHVLLLFGIMGALIGFLYYNWYPSKLFMGDTGSQFLGVFLAGIGILYFWNSADSTGHLVQSKQFFVSILSFIIPICDTTTVVINRLMRKQSPFIGGKDHTTHHLSYLGLSDSQVSLVFAGLSFISMLCTVFIIYYIADWGYIHIVIFGTYFLFIFGLLFYISKISKPKLFDTR